MVVVVNHQPIANGERDERQLEVGHIWVPFRDVLQAPLAKVDARTVPSDSRHNLGMQFRDLDKINPTRADLADAIER